MVTVKLSKGLSTMNPWFSSLQPSIKEILIGRTSSEISYQLIDIYVVAAGMGLRVKRKVEIISFVKISLTSTIF